MVMTGTPFKNRWFHSLKKCTVWLWLWLGLRCPDPYRVTMWVIHTPRPVAGSLRLATDTLKPRLQAAGGALDHIMLISPLLQEASLALASSRPYAFPRDLDHLADLIRTWNARLLIIDPA